MLRLKIPMMIMLDAIVHLAGFECSELEGAVEGDIFLNPDPKRECRVECKFSVFHVLIYIYIYIRVFLEKNRTKQNKTKQNKTKQNKKTKPKTKSENNNNNNNEFWIFFNELPYCLMH